jgi:hypothetical protein
LAKGDPSSVALAKGEAFACWHSAFAEASAFVKTMPAKTAEQAMLEHILLGAT